MAVIARVNVVIDAILEQQPVPPGKPDCKLFHDNYLVPHASLAQLVRASDS